MPAFDLSRLLRDIAAGNAPRTLDGYELRARNAADNLPPCVSGGAAVWPVEPWHDEPITVCGVMGEASVQAFEDRIVVEADDGLICADVHYPLDKAREFHRALGEAIAMLEGRAIGPVERL